MEFSFCSLLIPFIQKSPFHMPVQSWSSVLSIPVMRIDWSWATFVIYLYIYIHIYVLHGVGQAGTGQRSSRGRQGARGWRGRPGDSSALSDQYPGLPPECQQSNYNGFCTIVHREIKWENGFVVFLYTRLLFLSRTYMQLVYLELCWMVLVIFLDANVTAMQKLDLYDRIVCARAVRRLFTG